MITLRYSGSGIPLAALLSMVFLSAPCVFGQPVSFGVVAGASVLADFQNRMVGDIAAYSTPRGAIVGALFEVRLPLSLSVEVDGLYHEIEFTNAVVGPDGSLASIVPLPVVTWEFPVLAKYRFTLAFFKPFVEAGPAFRVSGSGNGSSPSNRGVVIGAGLEAQAWRLKVAPAVRYLRWAVNRNVGPIAPLTTPNQVEVVFGISF